MKLLNKNLLHKNQSGAALLEVLISILIFSFGLLGMVGLQVVATQNSADAESRTMASTLANDIVSQMWLKNPTSLADPVITTDITNWKTRVASITDSKLPNATGNITAAAGIATISISWKAPSKKSTDNANKFETQIPLPPVPAP